MIPPHESAIVTVSLLTVDPATAPEACMTEHVQVQGGKLITVHCLMTNRCWPNADEAGRPHSIALEPVKRSAIIARASLSACI